MAFLKLHQVYALGLKSFGRNVLISDKASFYNTGHITLGDNVRIDDFCILSAGSEITIGDYVHIACYTSLIGKGKIIVKDFVDISMKCTVMSSTSDASGAYLTNPTIPEEYLNTYSAPIVFEKYSVLYAMSMVLPGVTVGEGAAIGAMSLVKKDVPAYEIWAGNPLRVIRKRGDGMVEYAKLLKECLTVR